MSQRCTVVLEMARLFFTQREHVVTVTCVASGVLHLVNTPACDVTLAVEGPCPEREGL